MHALVVVSRYFGYLALRITTAGPLPESAFHTSLDGQRSAGSQRYRRTFVIGQIVGWTLVAVIASIVAWAVIALLV
jgi:hypothetical protein